MKKLQKILAVLLVVVLSFSIFAVPVSAARVSKRYNVLVLDISGSMYGTPLEELKEASTKFCKNLLDTARERRVNEIAIVTFDSYATLRCDFTNDVDTLSDAISQLYDRGSTALDDGLEMANNLLNQISDSGDIIKNIVVMSDGEPDSTSAVYNVLEIIPVTTTIYSLYFPHNYDSQYARDVMYQVGRGQYYEVEDGDKVLYTTFEEVGEDLSNADANLLKIIIACPVDVTVRLGNETLSKYNTKTSFGEMQLVDEGDNGTKKIITLAYSTAYEIEIDGYDDGEMDCSIEYLCNDNSLYKVTYPTVEVTMEMVATMSADVDDSTLPLEVDSDGDGYVDEEVYPKSSATGFFYRLRMWFINLFNAIFGIFG